MDCIPQYGVGKAEFTIKADANDSSVHFPAGFADLDDPSVTATASVDTDDATAVGSYFDLTPPSGGVLGLAKDPSGSSARKQLYDTEMIYKIASVSAIPISDLPAACKVATSVYATAWEVTYVPATITYTQTVGGKQWKYVVTSAPKPLFMGLPLDPTDGYVPIDVTETPENACAADDTQSLYTDNDFSSTDPDLLAIFIDHAYSIDILAPGSPIESTLSPFPNEGQPDTEGIPSIGDLGTFDRFGAEPVSNPTSTGPTLAVTGVNAAPAELLGGGLIAAGLLFFGLRFVTLRRRRRGEARHR